MNSESLKETQACAGNNSPENNCASSETKLQWWGTKRMTEDEFNDLSVDLHWSKYTQVKIEVVQNKLKE